MALFCNFCVNPPQADQNPNLTQRLRKIAIYGWALIRCPQSCTLGWVDMGINLIPLQKLKLIVLANFLFTCIFISVIGSSI